ncbi:MAG: bifunctional diaminohydroxyphosphoribosylaminopyrimidine deaminase/5-amino-6-(5-phosphoribosylamino)uracil reductase RibD [Deltaproteobacteria bacterium]|nr:bifunctional diaminohydroxyphosphoribosylaminopyrimidine deaminase/5-amino-6-(5-phosphoribosylamino)uracil reductase RibD [Deltaproteobacteria bacterium]
MSKAWAGLMLKALRQAVRGHGATGPNPLVGALVARDGRVVATGYHARVGEAHAEVMALDRAGAGALGADLVVTLEPCSHYGRTPPCVDRIVASGVRRVVVGCLDPNPREQGRGAELLRRAGLEVIIGVEGERCRRLNEAYFKYILTGIPFVVVKLAISLDGRIATRTGDARWISGPEAGRFVHGLRRDCNAVMVGGGTVRLDDPALTVRLVRPDTRPLRVVVSSGRDLPCEARVFHDQDRWPTVLFATAATPAPARQALEARGVRVEVVQGDEGRVDLAEALRRLGRAGVSRLLVEGGGELAGQLLAGGLIDRLLVIQAPVIIGSTGLPSVGGALPDVLSALPRYRFEWTRRLGADCLASVRMGPDYCSTQEGLGTCPPRRATL